MSMAVFDMLLKFLWSVSIMAEKLVSRVDAATCADSFDYSAYIILLIPGVGARRQKHKLLKQPRSSTAVPAEISC